MHIVDPRHIRFVVNVPGKGSSTSLAGEWIRLSGNHIPNAERGGNALGAPLVIHARIDRVLIVAGYRVVQKIVGIARARDVRLREKIHHIQRRWVQAAPASRATARGTHTWWDDVPREGRSLVRDR